MSLRSGLRRRVARVGIAALALIVGLFVGELVFRFAGPALGIDRRAIDARRQMALVRGAGDFQPRPYYSFVHPPGYSGANSLGFSAPEPSLERRPGVLRIACLGGSTTEGGNSLGFVGSFPGRLGPALQRRTGREVEVLNFAVASWTTAEMVAAWFLLVQDYRPDLVVLHEAVNDSEPRNWPGFRADYTHYRRTWRIEPVPALLQPLVRSSDLFVWLYCGRSMPTITDVAVQPSQGPYSFDGVRCPPQTALPYRRNVLSIGRSARQLGAQVLVATLPTRPPGADAAVERSLAAYRANIAEHNAILLELAREEGWLACDLAATAQALGSIAGERFLDLVHVDPLGNEWKASRMADVLVAGWEPLRAPASPSDAPAAPATR